LISVFALLPRQRQRGRAPIVLHGQVSVSTSLDGQVHDTPPHAASRHPAVAGALLALICLAMLPAGLLDAFVTAGTFASFGFVVVYFALCISRRWICGRAAR